MAKHVFILGAGASKEAGGPLMYDFLDRAEDLLREQSSQIDRPAFERTFAALAQLNHTQAKAKLDTLNIESVFGAFEMAKLFGTLGTLPVDEINALPDAIAKVIVQTVEHTVRFPVRERIEAPSGYQALARIVSEMVEKNGPDSAAVITFNYDLGMDLAMWQAGPRPEYRLRDFQRPNDPGTDLLKLHGSINWFKAEESAEIMDTPVPEHLRTIQFLGKKAGDIGLQLSRNIANAVIVPPSWSKLHQYARIERVWRAAAQHLRTAENIYVMGYSLPPSDSFFRLLYALGTASDQRLRRFWVFDPSKEVEQRFRGLLGPGAEERFKFRPWKFGEALSALASAWRTDDLPTESAIERQLKRAQARGEL